MNILLHTPASSPEQKFCENRFYWIRLLTISIKLTLQFFVLTFCKFLSASLRVFLVLAHSCSSNKYKIYVFVAFCCANFVSFMGKSVVFGIRTVAVKKSCKYILHTTMCFFWGAPWFISNGN